VNNIAILITAPASSGKTEYVLNIARDEARFLEKTPQIVLPSRLQAASWQERLARAGGALGVRVGTFDVLANEILNRSGRIVTHLSEPVQKRLLRRLVADMELTYFRRIQHMPGFIDRLLAVIRELKAGGISAGTFRRTIHDLGAEQRLGEIAQVYHTYQDRLKREGWTDYIGASWLALEALRSGVSLPVSRSPIIVDGFDDFTPIQMDILGELAHREGELFITLTASEDEDLRPVVHKRFLRTRRELENTISLEVIQLTAQNKEMARKPVIRHLEKTLFRDDGHEHQRPHAVRMIAAPDREGEVRSALRWLKQGIIREGWSPHETGIIFRDADPYYPYLHATAEEFGLPLYVEEGQPLRENPAIASLINVLRISDRDGETFPWRETVEAWRSPYFDWSQTLPADDAKTPVGIDERHAETLSWIARWGSVVQGLDQWQEAFEMLIEFSSGDQRLDEETPEPPAELPRGEDAVELREFFQRFVQRLNPPQGKHSYRTYIAWIEDLIGEEESTSEETGLNVVECIERGDEQLIERDLEALRSFKESLRGLLWAEKTIGVQKVSYTYFLEELRQVLEGATYQPSAWEREGGILAADVVEARGIPFKAAAIVGLGEGEFPRTIREDPFLRDDDRQIMKEEHGLPLSPSTLSWEGEYFYEGITRASQELLLTRSRIADNGAPWQPSPYWEEVKRRIEIEPEIQTSHSQPPLQETASKYEFLQVLCGAIDRDGVWEAYREINPDKARAVDLAFRILQERGGDDPRVPGPFDGELGTWEDVFSERYSKDHIWSSSRLESYKTCPYFFFSSHVLKLEPREPPQEGLDARQLGNIYHHIFEDLYREVGQNPDLDRLQAALPAVADRVLDRAPRKEGFRRTAWWEQTREEIKLNINRSLQVLEQLDSSFTFYAAEKTFGISGSEGPALILKDKGTDYLKLRGFIDRVDRDQQGRIRIVDYKTSAPYAFHNQAVRDGKKLQLPLYALAAQEALDLGRVTDGFYFHVRHAKPSRFQMRHYYDTGDRGPSAAMTRAVSEAWKSVHSIREGQFVPRVPDNNCPDYCPAAAFCWHYTPRRW